MRIMRQSSINLPPQRITALKRLAKKIDAEESGSIVAQGRAAFERHAQVRSIVQALKDQRRREGLSLTQLARRTGIAKPNLSRLENDERGNPSLDTLERYASAMGMTIRLTLATSDAA